MNRFEGYYLEELGIDSPEPTATQPEPQTEAERARAWLNSLHLETMPVGTGAKAEFYKYEVSVYYHKLPTRGDAFSISARSPQAQQNRYNMGDNYGFGTPETIRTGMERFIEKMESKVAKRNAKRDAKRQARAEFANPYNVGDILYSSWGYEQTNREFFQVLEVRPTSLKLRQIAQDRNEKHGWMSGTCVPCKDKFLKDPAVWVTIQIDANYHSIPSPIYGNLYKYEGKPLDWSGYH